MNPYCIAELAKIASLSRNVHLFTSLDKLAMSPSGGGFSTRCAKCSCKVKDNTRVCPKCGSKIIDKSGEDEISKDDSSPSGGSGDTGGEAAETQELAEDDETSSMGKYSSKKKPWWKPEDVLATPVGKAKAVGGLGLSSFAAVKLHQLTKDPPPGEKRASRIGPRGWNFKRKVSQKFVASPALKMTSWKKKSRRSAKGLI